MISGKLTALEQLNKNSNLPSVQDTKGSPLNPVGQVQTGLTNPDLSLPLWQVALEPQGLGRHKSFMVNLRQDTNGSPVNPGIFKFWLYKCERQRFRTGHIVLKRYIRTMFIPLGQEQIGV